MRHVAVQRAVVLVGRPRSKAAVTATLAISASPALAGAKFKDGIKLIEHGTMTSQDERVVAA
jgi:hypothetical protein